MSLTLASEAWHSLRGLVCVHKHSGVALRTLQFKLQQKLLSDLNCMQRSSDEVEGRHVVYGLVTADYSRHRLVLGPGFEASDLTVYPVNFPGYKVGGLTLFAINNVGLCKKFKSLRMPRRYVVKMELGKATDTCWANGGQVLEKSTFDHLVGRPQILAKAMASIRSSYQKVSFKVAKVGLQTQEAYELASKGLVRPSEGGEAMPPIIYGLECLSYKPPHVTLGVTCVYESQEFLAGFVHELGLQLRTNACCEAINLVKYGPVCSQHSLLLKHCDLQNVFDNMAVLKEVTQDVSKRMPANVVEDRPRLQKRVDIKQEQLEDFTKWIQ